MSVLSLDGLKLVGGVIIMIYIIQNKFTKFNALFKYNGVYILVEVSIHILEK